MNAFISASLDHAVIVQNAFARSRSNRTPRLPEAAAACLAERVESTMNAGKYHHERTRKRVTEMSGICFSGREDITTLQYRARLVNVVLISTYELGHQPFGLASPAAWLRARGHKVACFDLSRESFSDDAIRQADFVAFYVPMHTATRLAARLIEPVRGLNPRAHLCVYGLYASVNGEYFRGLGVQTVIGGEFEEALAHAVEATIPASPETVFLDRLSFVLPDRAGLPALKQYAMVVSPDGKSRVAGYTEASRGCKHLCRHCPIVPVYQGTFRVIPREIVLADIRQQVAAGATHITFGDPDFLNGPAHAMPIVEALHREFPAVTYDVTIKVEHLLRHSDHLPALRDSGCLFVTTAAESVDDVVLDRLDKGHTRADFLRTLETFRQLGMVLQPTFVPFTPWTTLESYRDLLSVIATQGLVENVTPIQLGIRLLIPAGSRLLELDEVRGMVGEFDPAGLLHPWRHAESRVDALSTRVQELAGAGEKLKQTRAEIFANIWRATAAAAGASEADPAWKLPALAVSAPVPRLSEPWYCCAEPTQDQFVAIGVAAPRASVPPPAPTGAGDFL
jgi:radical SAM superfamily enzyme YgiQ (UPF0313 family)